ncbi:MAG: NAD+ synthase [Candidatus Margulisiibacteriota bacterium]
MNRKDLSCIRVALCQINPTVGDLQGNAKKISEYIRSSKKHGCDIAVFPELAVTGYPPEDLLLKPDFIAKNLKALKKIASSCAGIAAIVGFVNKKGGRLCNSAAVIQNRKVICVYDKICLPNYGVFDEKRYFSRGSTLPAIKIGNAVFSVGICEDFWDEKGIKALVPAGSLDFMIAINASPYYAGKWKEREKMAASLARQKKAAIAYVNLVGGQDELVFDGHSFVISSEGKLFARARQFEEDLLVVDLPCAKNKITVKAKKVTKLYLLKCGAKNMLPIAGPEVNKPADSPEEIYKALCLGLKDYSRKNGFSKVVLGLSGGIDSALVAAIAADSLGSKNVLAVFMPSQYTSSRSVNDARKLAGNLGIRLVEIGIEKIFSSFLKALRPHFRGLSLNIAEENLQARIRGSLLMAFSNKFGHLLLATGNKSEVSTGYATLYGDMAGGLSLIKDVPKTLVYELANYRNKVSLAIPSSIINRAPTAELKHRQKDQDTLPPYNILDRIISAYVEKDFSVEKIAKKGINSGTVKRTVGMIDKSEYKRRQAAPGIKITPKAFGKDRRMPITNKFFA